MKFNLKYNITAVLFALTVSQVHTTEPESVPASVATNISETVSDEDLDRDTKRQPVPVPHAANITRLLSNVIFRNSSDFDDGTIFQYLAGDSYVPRKPEHQDPEIRRLLSENIEINVLDRETISKVIELLILKKEKGIKSGRRGYEWDEWGNHLWWQRYEQEKYKRYARRIVDWTLQSIYSVRYKMATTKKIRQKYKEYISYRIGVLIGSAREILIKMERIMETMNRFDIKEVEFIYVLTLYEKLLAMHTDVINAVERCWLLHRNELDPKAAKEQEVLERKQKIENFMVHNNIYMPSPPPNFVRPTTIPPII